MVVIFINLIAEIYNLKFITAASPRMRMLLPVTFHDYVQYAILT